MATATKERMTEEVPDRLYRISLDLYRRIGEQGLLTTHDRVMLLDGLLVKRMTKKPPHVAATEKTRDQLEPILPAGWHIREEKPIEIARGPGGLASVPEPDIIVAKGPRGTYDTRHPVPEDVGLLIEVAESSLAEDRKGLSRYAFVSIPRVWIINLIDRVVEVYESPTGPSPTSGYRRSRVDKPGDRIDVRLGRRIIGQVAVDDLLPRQS